MHPQESVEGVCVGAQVFDWLQPTAAGPGAAVQTPDPIAAKQEAAKAAAAPRSLQDAQNVRSFISQAGNAKPITGRRLAEVSTPPLTPSAGSAHASISGIQWVVHHHSPLLPVSHTLELCGTYA